MRVAALYWCTAIPGLQSYLFRRIRDDLINNHMEGPKGFRALLAPWTSAGFVTIVEEEICFWNGSKIYLCHCKDPKDVYKYQGAEIHVLLIDELTHFLEPIYRFLRSARVREFGAASGWGQVRGRLLGNDDGEPMIFCFSTCLDSIRTIPVLQHDPDRLEDLDTTQEDHAADDWRYACNSRPWIKPTPPKKPEAIIKPRWLTFKELMDEHDRRTKMKRRRI